MSAIADWFGGLRRAWWRLRHPRAVPAFRCRLRAESGEVGFFTTRWVATDSRAEAIRLAIEHVRADQDAKAFFADRGVPFPDVEVYDCERVLSDRVADSRIGGGGFTFFAPSVQGDGS